LKEGEFLKSVVTNRQIFFILFLLITGYSSISIPKDAIKAAGTGAWLTILLLTILFAIAAFFISSLNKKFEGKTIFEYSPLIVGKPIAYVINIFYTSYFLFVLILICRSVSEFIKVTFMPLTPIWAMLFIIVAVCFYISYKGITNVGRLCEIYGLLVIVVAFPTIIAMFFLGDINYILPFFDISQVKEYVFGTKDLIVAFLGIEVLLIIPFGKVNNKKGVLYSVLAVLSIGLLYILLAEASTMILGINDILNYDNSLVEGLRETSLPNTFLLERVDHLFLTVGMMGIISGLSILFYTTVEYATKLIRVNKNILFLSIGITTYIVSNFFIDGELATFLFDTVVPICGIFTAFIIPITLFLIAKVKKI